MFKRDDEQATRREAFVESWRLTEKRLERIGGVLAIFAGGLVLALEQPGDQLTAIAAAVFIALGLMFLMRSRRPSRERIHLYFLSQQRQASRAAALSLGAIFVLYQGWQMNRPLLMIVALCLVVVAGWYQWRALKVQQYDALFIQRDEDGEGSQGHV